MNEPAARWLRWAARAASVALVVAVLWYVGAKALQTWSDDPSYQRTGRAQIAVREFMQGIEAFHAKNRRYPEGAEATTLIPAGPHNFGAIGWEPGSRSIVVNFHVGPIEGKRLVVESKESGGKLLWRCSSDLPDRFRRRICRGDTD